MPVRSAEAEWKGSLAEGSGHLRSETGALDAAYSARARFEDGSGTNPEELIGAAHAGCFSMALAHALTGAGHRPERVHTTARVHLRKDDGGFTIHRIELRTTARVPGIGDDELREIADDAARNCPVSRALAGPDIDVDARLEG